MEIWIPARISRALRAAAGWAEDHDIGMKNLGQGLALCALIVICAVLLGSNSLGGSFMGDERSWSSGLLSQFLSGRSHTDLTRARARRMPRDEA